MDEQEKMLNLRRIRVCLNTLIRSEAAVIFHSHQLIPVNPFNLCLFIHDAKEIKSDGLATFYLLICS